MRPKYLALFAALTVAMLVYVITREPAAHSTDEHGVARVRQTPVAHRTEVRETLSANGPRLDLAHEIETNLAADPIAQAIPMLYEMSKEKRLETLYWMKYMPRQTLPDLLPHLGEGADMSLEERQQLAQDVVDGFIADLERQGVKAPRFH